MRKLKLTAGQKSSLSQLTVGMIKKFSYFKIGGAGGGGFVMFITNNKKKLRNKLERFKLNELDIKFEYDGSTIISRG